jgi:glutathione peroxidase
MPIQHILQPVPTLPLKTNRILRTKTLFRVQISVRLCRWNGTMQLSMQLLPPSPKLFVHMMNCRSFLFCLAALIACAVPAMPKEPAAASKTIYDFSLVDQDGKVVPLSTYKGKLLLIVNLASQSVYKSQISALNELAKSYSARGLVVLGIPSPDFGGEELKDPAALRKYYADTEHVDFPVFASATITGVNAIPLYQFLCDPKQSVPGGDIRWNYTKFLIDREGKPLARYEVDVDPADIDFHVTIEQALDGKLKKQTGNDQSKSEDSDSDRNE